MNQVIHKNLHWPYFLSIESDLESLSRYIEFDQENFAVFSAALLRFQLITCAEIDDVMKSLCRLLEPELKLENINSYKEIARKHLPALITQKIECPKYGFTFEPWIEWGRGNNPTWWQDHNKVKHNRQGNYILANLGNVFNSLAGLFAANIHYNHVLLSQGACHLTELKHTISQLRVEADLFRVANPFVYWKD